MTGFIFAAVVNAIWTLTAILLNGHWRKICNDIDKRWSDWADDVLSEMDLMENELERRKDG